MESTSTAIQSLEIALQYFEYVNYAIFIAGIIGNVINILVFTHSKFFQNNRCIFYLTIESISDLFHQLCSITLIILALIYGNIFITNSLILCRLMSITDQLFGRVTFSMICFTSADLYFSTNYRPILRQMCTFKLARCLVFTSVAIWFLHSILYSFSLNIVPSIGCIVTNPTWIQYATFFHYPVLAGFLPIVIASSFSLLAFHNVRHIIRRQVPIERRRFNRQITAMVLLRVLCFVFFTLPYIIYHIYSVNVPITHTNHLKYAIVQLIQAVVFSIATLNYTANFYIFMISSSRYRRQVKYVLMKKCWKRWKNWHFMNNNKIYPERRTSFNANTEHG